jgi:hypothetical protein
MTDANEKLNQLAQEVLNRIVKKTGDRGYGIQITQTMAFGVDGFDFNIMHSGQIVQTFNVYPDLSGYEKVSYF